MHGALGETPRDPLEPGMFQETRRPLLEASTLPGYCYTSEEWYRREVEAIFMREWLLVGRADQIPRRGDWFSEEICGERVLLVRGDDGAVRAFSPVCRHRGTVIAEGSGTCKIFVCPYHAWSYGLDGRLLGTPHADSIKGLDSLRSGLVPIRLAEWMGFLYVTFNAEAPPLVDTLGGLADLLARYRLDELVHTRKKTYRVACNWKLYAENSIEVYHVASVHGGTIEAVGPMSTWTIEDPTERYLNLYGTFPGSLALLEGDKGFPPIAGLGRGPVERHDLPWVLPNNHFLCSADVVWWLTMFPEGPSRTRIEVNSSFPKATVDHDDFEDVVAAYYRRLDVTNPEDNVISEVQQRGMTQRFARRGRFTEHERLVHAFDNYVVDKVIGAA